MGSLQFTSSDYRNMLKFSHKKHLLVEGKNDKRLFQYLIDELFRRFDQDISQDDVNIDTVEHLIESGRTNNREKVELICESVSNAPYKDILVGFVDREFREFERNEHLKDKLNDHNISGRVMWSRGHSSENYYFDFNVLREPLREQSDTDQFRQALDQFETVLDSTLRVACAMSLAAEELKKLDHIKRSINWKLIEITSSHVQLKLDLLKKMLVNTHNFTDDEANRFIERYIFGYKLVEKADSACIKWMSHGHIGFSLIWAVYGYCVFEICQNNGVEKPESEVAKVLGFKEDERFRACANVWVRRAFDNQVDYPLGILTLLGLSIASHT